MDFSQTQRDPTRKFVGIGAVLVFHIIIVYALITGLARKVVEVVKGPIEVKVIEEVIKKPPPPPELLPPPPKLQAPPPPFIPPPEINIQPPPTPAPTITAVTPEAPPAPQAPVIAAPRPRPLLRRRRCKALRSCVPTIAKRWVRLPIRAKRRSTIFRARCWPNSRWAPMGRYATSSSRAVRIACSTSPRYR